MDFRKQLSLALQSIAKTKNPHIKLHIVGGGNNLPYQALAKIWVSNPSVNGMELYHMRKYKNHAGK